MGLAQGQRAAAEVALLRPTRIVTSDLRRAHETAEMVGARCGVAISDDVRLREVALGDWEGLRHDEVEDRFPAEYAAWRAGEDVRRGGGETAAEAGDRVAAVLMELARALGVGGTGVVVSHGVALQSSLHVLAAKGLLALDTTPKHLNNGEWAVTGVRPAADTRKGWPGTLR